MRMRREYGGKVLLVALLGQGLVNEHNACIVHQHVHFGIPNNNKMESSSRYETAKNEILQLESSILNGIEKFIH